MDSLGELAARLLSHLGPDLRPLDVELLPGQAPGELPLELPLPPGARLLGSVAYRSDGALQQAIVLLDVDLSPEDALSFYRRELPARGWSALPPAPQPGGFVLSSMLTAQTFCQGERDSWLSVTAQPHSENRTEVRIQIDLSTAGPCSGAPGPAPYVSYAGERLPPLTVPPGVRLYPGGSGGSDDHWFAHALAETDLSAAELEAHLAGQLERQGWERVATSSAGPVVCSAWRVAGEDDWQGILVVAEWPGRTLRSLLVTVERTPITRRGWWAPLA
uniref:Uncharacterized protein n=1 Tax=Thermorudis peleae TaxID=1382356 RepID=A0A831X843_9BACT